MIILHNWQVEALEIFNRDKKLIANCATGTGKCLGKGTPILMYSGSIKKVEEIVVGDILMGDDSRPRKVLTTTYGKGLLYEVSQKNGEPYIVNSSHILSLKINSNSRLKEFEKNQVIDIPITKYISLGYKQYYLKGYKTSELEFSYDKQTKLIIDPYFLGLWLADGTSRNSGISKPDIELRKWLEIYAKKLGMDLSISGTGCPVLRIIVDRNTCEHRTNGSPINKLLNKMRELGIIQNKHIPFNYKISTILNRQRLLAGLLDGDGYFYNGCYEIIQKNDRLAEDIVFIARSLGLRCSIRKVNKGIKSRNFKGIYNKISLSGRNLLKLPLLIARKKAHNITPNKDELRCAISVKEKGVGEYYGFEIDGNKRFVLGDFTVTHNSIFAIEVIKQVRAKDPDINILIVAPKIVILETVWLKELYAQGFPPNLVGLYYGYAKEFSKITLTTIASIPKLDMGIFDMIICDEIHNMMSPNLAKLLRHKFAYMLGLSASIKTLDQRHWKLLEAFDYNIYEYGIREAIKDGIINKFNFTNVGVKIDDDAVMEKYEHLEAELKSLLKAYGGFEKILRRPADDSIKMSVLALFGQRNDLINNYVKKIDVVCKLISDNPGKKILLFSQYNKITRGIYWALKETDVGRSEIIDTNVKEELRKQFLKDFEDGKYNVLLSSRIFEEGYNLPAIDMAIFLSSNSTSRQMIQRLGRILRKKDTPSEAYYIYCKDTFEEDYSNRAKEFVTDVAEKIIEMEY